MVYVLIALEGLEIGVIMVTTNKDLVLDQYRKQWQQHRLHQCISSGENKIQCEQCGRALEIHTAQMEV